MEEVNVVMGAEDISEEEMEEGDGLDPLEVEEEEEKSEPLEVINTTTGMEVTVNRLEVSDVGDVSEAEKEEEETEEDVREMDDDTRWLILSESDNSEEMDEAEGKKDKKPGDGVKMGGEGGESPHRGLQIPAEWMRLLEYPAESEVNRCAYCGQMFDSPTLLRDHIWDDHGNESDSEEYDTEEGDKDDKEEEEDDNDEKEGEVDDNEDVKDDDEEIEEDDEEDYEDDDFLDFLNVFKQ